MKRVFALLVAVLMCAVMVLPASAEVFTPSVTNKPAPTIVPVIDDQGVPHIGVIKDADGKILDYVDADCIVITSIADADTSTEIPVDAKNTLLWVYQRLVKGEMTMPYHLHNPNYNSDDMVIRDMFDVTFLCGDHPEMLEAAGVVLELIFDIGVKPEDDVSVMTYKEAAWNDIHAITNNGDGTITATFEHLCPVAFSVAVNNAPPSQTGDTDTFSIWGIVALAALLAIGVLTVLYVRSTKKESV